MSDNDKFTDGEENYEYQEIHDNSYLAEQPYDTFVINKLNLNTQYLMKNRSTVSQDLWGGGAHNLTAKTHERPFTSATDVSSFLQIPWYRNVGESSIRVYMYCRVGHPSVETEAGIYQSTGSYAQVSLSKETLKGNLSNINNANVSSRTDGIKFLGNANDFIIGEWQWIQIDYEPESGRSVDFPEWDMLHIGFGFQTQVSQLKEAAISIAKRVDTNASNVLKTDDSSYFNYDTAVSAPDLDSFNVSYLVVVDLQEDPVLGIPTSNDGNNYGPFDVALFDGLTTTNNVACNVWTSNKELIPNKTDWQYVAQMPAPYMQVRTVIIESIGTEKPYLDADVSVNNKRSKSNRRTINDVPINIKQRVSNIRERKHCIMPFVTGYKPVGGEAIAGNLWTDREYYLRHPIIRGGGSPIKFVDELKSVPTNPSTIEVAINGTGFYNNMRYPTVGGSYTTTETAIHMNMAEDTRNIDEVLDQALRGEVRFTVNIKQWDDTIADWLSISNGDNIQNFPAYYLLIVGKPKNSLSQHLMNAALSMSKSYNYMESFNIREGMITMGNSDLNVIGTDALFMVDPRFNYNFPVPISGYNPNKPIRIEVTGYVETAFFAQANAVNPSTQRPWIGDVDDNGMITLIPDRIFFTINGCSIWAY